jgi:hypothetical protein
VPRDYYDDTMIARAIATREAAIEAQRLEAQRLATIQSRANQYAQARAQVQPQAAQAQAQAERQASQAAQAQAAERQASQAAQAQAQAERQAAQNERSELPRLMPGIDLRTPRVPSTFLGPRARSTALESGHLRMPNVLALENDEFGPILPTRELGEQEIHPGDTGNPAADYEFWYNQVNVEEQRLIDLHTRYPVLENYANVPMERLRTVLYRKDNPTIPPGVINAEVEARENIIEVRNNLIISMRNLHRSTLDRSTLDRNSSTSNATQQLADGNLDQIQAASMNAVPEAEIREKRKAFYDLHEKYNQVRKLQGKDVEEIPEELLCPLTSEYMVDPVSEAYAKHENTYERSNILTALLKQGMHSQLVDPYTRVPIYPCTLLPDKERKAKIAEYQEKMQRYISNYEGVQPSQSNLASGKKLRKLIQSIKKRKSKQAKQTKQATHANRRHAKLSKKYKKQYTKRVH